MCVSVLCRSEEIESARVSEEGQFVRYDVKVLELLIVLGVFLGLKVSLPKLLDSYKVQLKSYILNIEMNLGGPGYVLDKKALQVSVLA